jgi:putative transposase
MLKNKAKNSNVKIIEVNPKNTTKNCSNCGNKQDMPLCKREYKCKNCGLELNRDYNSAINILNKGLGQASVEKHTSTPCEQVVSVNQEAIS